MIAYLKLDNLSLLPEIHQLDLAKVMWEGGYNYSRCGNDCYINKCTELTLSWDKWIDDNMWANNAKTKEYIDFEYDQNEKQLIVEIDDDSLIVDKRAFHRAVVFISKHINTGICLNNIQLYTVEDYEKEYSYLLDISFNEAVNSSLNIN